MRLHLELLYVSLVLGKYDRGLQEIEILHRFVGRLNDRQRLRLQLLSIDYRISTNGRLLTAGELETAERLFRTVKRIKKKRHGKNPGWHQATPILYRRKMGGMRRLLENIESLSKNVTVFKQVSVAYLRGKCYCRDGKTGGFGRIKLDLEENIRVAYTGDYIR